MALAPVIPPIAGVEIRQRAEANLAGAVVVTAPPLGTDAACIVGQMPVPGHVVGGFVPPSVAFNANVFCR